MLFNDLEGWDGLGCGREIQEGGNIRILMTDSFCYVAETNMTLLSNYPHFKKLTVLLKAETTFFNNAKLLHFKRLENFITGQQERNKQACFYEGTLKLFNPYIHIEVK